MEMLSDAWLYVKNDSKKFLDIVPLKYPADSLRRFLFLEFFPFNNASWLSTFSYSFIQKKFSNYGIYEKFIMQVYWHQEYNKLLKILTI
jgi:hypothetical protein